MVSYKRHIAKTISYRIISTLSVVIVIWQVTGNIQVGAIFGLGELIIKPILYFLHERIWYKYFKYGIESHNN